VDDFKFAALGYLNNWFQYDKRFVEGLRSGDISVKLKSLRGAANAYHVTRNFKTCADEDDKNRLQHALAALEEVGGSSVTEEDVDAKVCKLASEIERLYGKHTVSAASKFLWFRYRSPVVMYDSQARGYLQGLCKKDCSTYQSYRATWRERYAAEEDSVRDACAELVHVKSFSLAREVDDEALQSLVREEWFQERVFDWFLWGNGRPQDLVSPEPKTPS